MEMVVTYFSSHNSLFLLISSLLTEQLFINHFFYLFGDYIYLLLCSKHFFLFFFNH